MTAFKRGVGITQSRNRGEIFNDYLFCVKCKVRKSINKFEQIGNPKTFSKFVLTVQKII